MAEFTQELFDTICERIASGESLRSICSDEGMPSQTAVFKWLAADKIDPTGGALVEQYARAREAQADALFDDVLSIADDARNDWMERRGEDDAGWVANGEHIQRSRLRIDARKWMAGKLRPKVYGERQEISGPGGGPIQTEEVGGASAKLTAFLDAISSRAPGSPE